MQDETKSPKPYRKGPCPNCSKPHPLKFCPGPVDASGYVPGCGACNTLDHILPRCPKPVIQSDVRYYIFSCRSRRPPMIWDTDLLDPSLRSLLLQRRPWTRKYACQYALKTDSWEDIKYQDPAWEAEDFDIAALGPQIHPSIIGSTGNVRGDITRLNGPAQPMKSTKHRKRLKQSNTFKVNSPRSTQVHQSQRTPPHATSTKIPQPDTYASHSQASYMASASASAAPHKFAVTHPGSSAAFSQSPSVTYDVITRAEKLYATKEPLPNQEFMSQLAKTHGECGGETQTNNSWEVGSQSDYGVKDPAASTLEASRRQHHVRRSMSPIGSSEDNNSPRSYRSRSPERRSYPSPYNLTPERYEVKYVDREPESADQIADSPTRPS